MTPSIRSQLLIVLVAGIVIFTNLGKPRLWDEDEPKNAQCAYEMFERGDWIVPTFNGDLRTDKPILLYWFMLIAYHLFGTTEFAARLPSAICGIGTALLTFHLGRRLFNASVGLWAGLLVSSSMWFVVASRAATPDGLLIFFSTLALWLYVRSTVPADKAEPLAAGESHPGIPTSGWAFLGMYAAMGMAVLAKGPIGVLLPGSVIGCFVLAMTTPKRSVGNDAHGRLAFVKTFGSWVVRTFWPIRIAEVAWKLRPVTAMLVVGVISIPWYVAVGLQTDWEWPKGFFLDHNVGRFSSPMEGHSGPPLYHIISIAVCFFPASIFLAPMILNVIRQLREPTGEHNGQASKAGFVFATSWIAVYVIFFSIAGTKLPSYVTPTYPALAMLTGCFLYQWIKSPAEISRVWQRIALVVFGVVGIVMLLALPLVTKEFAPGEEWLGAIGLIPLLGAVVAIVASERGRVRWAAASFVVFATLYSTSMFGWAVLRIDRFQTAGEFADTINRNSQGDPEIAEYHFFRPSWVYYNHRVIERMGGAKPADAVEHFKQSADAFILTDDTRFKELQEVLPSDVEVLLRRPRFLKDGDVILLGRRRSILSDRPAVEPDRASRL